MDAFLLVVYAALTVVLLLGLLCLSLLVICSPYPSIIRLDGERHFYEPITGKMEPFPSLADSPSIHLSIVVPAYNEEKRLPPMLDEALEFLEERVKGNESFKYEIIVVSDGSSDRTANVATRYSEKYGSDKIRVIDLVRNRGKGGAVRLGVLSSRGALILFADADGATKFSDLTKLEAGVKMLTGVDYLRDFETASGLRAVVCGSRAHLEEKALASRSILRNILMFGFHFLVWFFGVQGVRDTQCGFKLFTRKAASHLFASLHVERWAFDVELLYIAQQLRIPIEEVAVNWTEIEGSKIVPVWSWLQMGKDLFLIWLRYSIGAWKICAQTK